MHTHGTEVRSPHTHQGMALSMRRMPHLQRLGAEEHLNGLAVALVELRLVHAHAVQQRIQQILGNGRVLQGRGDHRTRGFMVDE